jgi:hypothetical protein
MKKAPMNPNLPGRYGRMTAGEWDAEVAQYDKPLAQDDFGPPSPEALAQLRRAKRKRGRPTIGKGAKDVMISVEKDLLKAADRYAKAHGISRSELFARGVRGLLKAG